MVSNEQEKNKLARALQREYLNEWRAKNKDKVRQYNQRYWIRKAEQIESAQERAVQVKQKPE